MQDNTGRAKQHTVEPDLVLNNSQLSQATENVQDDVCR